MVKKDKDVPIRVNSTQNVYTLEDDSEFELDQLQGGNRSQYDPIDVKDDVVVKNGYDVKRDVKFQGVKMENNNEEINEAREAMIHPIKLKR
jgi:hypothetical protein